MKYSEVDWSQAACAGTWVDSWYLSGDKEYRDFALLRRVCEACPINADCANYAIRYELHGVWAGMTETDREKARRRMGVTYGGSHAA